jgi:hypothetical protein
MMKNCGDAVHAYVAERDVLKEMVKIVKKKASFCIGYELYYYIPYFRNKVIYIYFFFPSETRWPCQTKDSFIDRHLARSFGGSTWKISSILCDIPTAAGNFLIDIENCWKFVLNYSRL